MLTFRKMQKRNWFEKNAPKKVENAAGEKVGRTRPCGGDPRMAARRSCGPHRLRRGRGGCWSTPRRWRGLRASARGRGVENHQYAPQGRQRGMRKPPPGWDRRRFSRGRWPYEPAGAGVIRNPCDKCRRRSPYVRCWVNSGNLMLALTFSAFDPTETWVPISRPINADRRFNQAITTSPGSKGRLVQSLVSTEAEGCRHAARLNEDNNKCANGHFRQKQTYSETSSR